MSSLDKGTWVWLEIEGVPYLKSGVISEILGEKGLVVLADKQSIRTTADQVRPLDPNTVDGVPDMINLADLHEGSLIHNLRARYHSGDIYTYVGSILVAINPYKSLSIYEPDTVRLYTGKPIGELPPHLFAIADHVYRSLLKDMQNQCVIISGESGAGKTETTKIVLQYLALLSGKHSQIEERILASSPILETFGNACTVKNNNSSRFGKFIEIQFNEQGYIEGGKINEYLLEKSRIVALGRRERNYHSFYVMLSGLDDATKKKWNLTKPADFYYLNQSDITTVDSINDKEDFDRLCGALDNIDFSAEMQTGIFQTLALILHLGNITFKKSETDDTAEISNAMSLAHASKLMEIGPEDFGKLLTTRSSVTRQETFVTPLNVAQACDTRDALSKALYSWLFDWLVGKVNEKTVVNGTRLSIGVLDIFGFEDFEKNSFEQLCINYANEKLQQFFNNHIFKLEQEEYKKEKISWDDISFTDNQQCLDLISKKPLGILQLLDEESSLPKATDKSFVEKVKNNHEKNPYFSKSKTSTTTFVLAHYAGKIEYALDGFLDKNRDLLRPDLEKSCMESNFKFLNEIINSQIEESTRRLSVKNPTSTVRAPQAAKKTAGSKFDESLGLLITNLNSCHPHFVRCIKPNMVKKADVFDENMVLLQLRYSGLLETIKIRQSGFPVRRSYQDFCFRYNFLLKESKASGQKEKCQELLAKFPDTKGRWQLGVSRIFYKESLDTMLEKSRSTCRDKYVLKIQTFYRMYILRKKYRSAVRAALFLQAFWRLYRVKSAQRIRLRAARKIQSFYRCCQARHFFLLLKKASSITVAAYKILVGRALVFSMKQEIESAASDALLLESVKLASNHSIEDIQKAEELLKKRTMTAISKSAYLIEQDAAIKAMLTDRSTDLQRADFLKNMAKVSLNSYGEVLDPCQPYPEYEDSDNIAGFEFSKFSQTYFVKASDEYSSVPLQSPLLSSSADSLKNNIIACSECIMILMDNIADEGSDIAKIDRFQYLVSMVIDNPSLNDEIYCQIVKQIKRNPVPMSAAKGWRLLAALLEFFPPSGLLSKYLYNFVGDQAPVVVIPLLETRTLRSMDAGPRKKHVAIEEIVELGTISLPVVITLPNGNEFRYEIDSISTGDEILIRAMTDADYSTYSTWCSYEEIDGLYSRVGKGHHLFDCIRPQLAALLNEGGAEFPRRVSIRKEFQDTAEVLREDKLVDLSVEHAKHVLKGLRISVDAELLGPILALHSLIVRSSAPVQDVASEIIPNAVISQEQLIIESYAKNLDLYGKEPIPNLKRKFVLACGEVPALYARLFIIQLKTFEDEEFPILANSRSKNLQLAVDRHGIQIYDEKMTIFHTLLMSQVIAKVKDNDLALIADDGKIIASTDQAHAIVAFINDIKKSLAISSKWALAMDDHFTAGDEKLLPLQKGDIIEITERSSDNAWWKGINRSLTTPREGSFPMAVAHVLLSKPKIILQRIFINEETRDAPLIVRDRATSSPAPLIDITRSASPTLLAIKGAVSASVSIEENLFEIAGTRTGTSEQNSFEDELVEWAAKNFRPEKQKKNFGNIRGTIRKLTGSEGLKDGLEMDTARIKEKFVHSKVPITHGMLKHSADLDKLAVECFQLIMKFMGDYPCNKDQTAVDCSKLLIDRALENDVLCNEIVMQMMRQVTGNANESSVTRGWWLIEVCSNYFAPTGDFVPLFMKWLQIIVSPFASTKKSVSSIDKNLRIVCKIGARKSKPSMEEITFLELGRPASLQVFILDKTYKRLHIHPCTPALEVTRQMCQKFDVTLVNGNYEIFALDGSTYHMIFSDEYIMDSLAASSPAGPRKIIFRRAYTPKGYVPDSPAELNLIYHQIIELFHTGFTKPSLSICSRFAALQVRATSIDVLKVSAEERDLTFKSMIPASMYGSIKPEVWARQIGEELATMSKMDGTMARKELIRESSSNDLFGAAIFHIKDPKCDKVPLPHEIALSVMHSGIQILHSVTKDSLATWKFSELAGYSYGPDKLNIKFGGMMSKNQIMFKADTVQGREVCHFIDMFSALHKTL